MAVPPRLDPAREALTVAPDEVVVVCVCDRAPHLAVCALLNEINRKVGLIMAAQDDINAAVAAISAVTDDLTAAAANIQAEIAALGVTVDTSGLTAAVTALQGAQAAVDALETPAP